jgi:hypothetical protein
MRQKECRLIITFPTTSQAIAMEELCKKKEAPGRLIPVPKSISAGCGLSWSAPPECREELTRLMEEAGIKVEGIQECMV